MRSLSSPLVYCAPALGLLALWLHSGAAWAASGGPDAFGYTWADSNSGGPAYAYVVNNGASDLGLSDDDSAVVAIGFPFEFYGQTYTEVTVHSNGGLSFGATSSWLSASNACPLNAGGQPSLVAPLWTDLDPSAGFGGVWAGSGLHPNGMNVFTVEWWEVEHYQFFGISGAATFEIILFEDGSIEYHYEDVDFDDSSWDYGADASIGLVGSSTFQLSCNSAYLVNQYAVGYYPPGAGCVDNDADGACEDVDCDDWNAQANPSALEACDGFDNNCDGQIDEGFDLDLDGWSTCAGDCDDTDPAVSPGDVEACDGLDNDCDGVVDNGFDNDGDGWAHCDGDCDDTTSTVSPDAMEVCDGVDNNCDEQIDEGFDLDSDGWTSCEGDCDDTSASTFPGAWDEVGDGIDQDCDGIDGSAAGDDDDASGDDDDASGDDDDASDDDDDATGDDDDSAALEEGELVSFGCACTQATEFDNGRNLGLLALAVAIFGVGRRGSGRSRVRWTRQD